MCPVTLEGQLFFIIKDISKGTLISDTLRSWDSIAVAYHFEDLVAGKSWLFTILIE